MTHRMTWILVVALFLIGWLQPAIAEQILLKQSDGTTTPWGGVGEKGSVTCDNCSGGGGGGGGGGAVQTLTIASGVTTNTTTAAVAGVSGPKTYWARVTGTGSVAATVEFRGCLTNANTDCVSLGTLTVSGTTSDRGVPSNGVSSASYPYLCIVTTSVTGTGASVDAGAFY